MFVAAWIVLAAPLATPVRAAENPNATPRVVWQGPDVNTLGAPSRDGRWLSYVDVATGDLAVRDLASGENRFVTRKDPGKAAGEFAYFSVISPDGRTVALAWFNSEGFYDLRLAKIRGRRSRAAARHL